MFTNYIKVAFRNLWKHKGYSLINLAGLATGLCCFLLIAMYVLDELSYDRYNKMSDRIYRINSDLLFGGNNLHLPVSSDMMGAALKKDDPEVEEYARIYVNGNKLIKKGNDFIKEFDVAHVDSTFFDVFSFTALGGDLHTALNEPNTVVLSASAARKYFGTTQAVGHTIEVNDKNPLYKVTAVVADMPTNAHFHFDFFFSMKNVNYNWGQYLSHNFYTYLLLKKGASPTALEKKFGDYITRYVMPQADLYMHIKSVADFEKAGNRLFYSLTPLTAIHLHSDRAFELGTQGNIQYIYIFSAVALLILLIACINFMNLTTARSAARGREVGIRKVLGTERKNLMAQFLIESTLMVLLSLLVAIALAYFILPLFNEVAGKSMRLHTLFSPLVLPLLLALPFVVGLIAGSYPAFFLSGFRPIQVLKGRTPQGRGHGRLRSLLVVVQFATSIILIIGTIVVYRQLHYIQTRNLGFSKDQVLVLNDTYALKKNLDAFRNEVLQVPGVISGTVSGFLPVTNSSRNDNSFSKESVMDAQSGFNMQVWSVDYDYLKTMGMELAAGRNFSRDFGADSSGIVINETTARQLGYDNPVGKRIYQNTFDPNKLQAFTIIGVVKNFNFESLKKTVGPLALILNRSTDMISFKVKAGRIPDIIKNVEQKWKAMAPGMPFSYRFLNDSFNNMYADEQRVGKIAMSFSILAILIACLGLFGLASFIAEQRTKEIGIRKVLGASVQGIVQLLSKDFVRLVLLSFLIAAPLAWWTMRHWLQDFAYRADLSWWIFLVAGVAALFIALATISFQAVRAAVSNPVKSLRSE